MKWLSVTVGDNVNRKKQQTRVKQSPGKCNKKKIVHFVIGYAIFMYFAREARCFVIFFRASHSGKILKCCLVITCDTTSVSNHKIYPLCFLNPIIFYLKKTKYLNLFDECSRMLRFPDLLVGKTAL